MRIGHYYVTYLLCYCFDIWITTLLTGEIAQLLNRSTKADSIKLHQLLEEYMLESSDQDLSDDDSECMSHVSDDKEDGFDMTDVTID